MTNIGMLLTLFLVALALCAAKHHDGHGHHDNEEAENQELTYCQLLVSSSTGLIGAFRPQCDNEGNFHPLQCDGSTGFCWCVNATGDVLDGSLSSPSNPRPVCPEHQEQEDDKYENEQEEQHVPTACEVERELARTFNRALESLSDADEEKRLGRHDDGPVPSPLSTPVPISEERLHVPKCTKSGNYKAKQCEGHGKKKVCWCVNKVGEELSNTRFGKDDVQINCKEARVRAEHEETTETTEEQAQVGEANGQVEDTEVAESFKTTTPRESTGKYGFMLSGGMCMLAAALVALIVIRSRKHPSLASQDATEVVV